MLSVPNKFILAQWFWIFLIFGCTDIQVKEERITDTGIGANETISFIIDRSLIREVKDAQKIEVKIEECIDKALKKLDPPVQTVSAETFRKTAFPDMEYLSVPSSPYSLMELLKNPEFTNRIKPLGLRYLLTLQGESRFTDFDMGVVGGGPAGVLIILWDKQSKMSVNVLDLAKGFCAGEVKTKALGHGWFVIFGYALGFPAISEGPACNALGKQVAEFIIGKRKK